MATAGDRYEERTGNIWSYAHRGDMTGLKAAILRGVDANMTNTVGWTACHAAAAGGQTKVLRYLVTKTNADLTIVDKGGNLSVHHAAKNGHVHALRTLQELGADVTRVRLSQAKGKAVRDFVIESYRKAGKQYVDGDSMFVEGEDEIVEPVGYARKQSKSTAFWGPRRTPISCAIKKKIMKDKRKLRKEKRIAKQNRLDEQITLAEIEEDNTEEQNDEPSYIDTVQQIKRNRRQKRRQRQQPSHPNTSPEDELEENVVSMEKGGGEKYSAQDRMLNDIEGLTIQGDSSDDSSDDENRKATSTNQGRFAALALIGDDSDSE